MNILTSIKFFKGKLQIGFKINLKQQMKEIFFNFNCRKKSLKKRNIMLCNNRMHRESFSYLIHKNSIYEMNIFLENFE